jgi:hypothetical protein
MNAKLLLGSLAALASLPAGAQTMDFASGFGTSAPGIASPSLPPFLTGGLGATTLNDRVPGIGSIGTIGGGIGSGIGTGIGTGPAIGAGIGTGIGSTSSIGIGSLQPGGLRADLFGRLPNLTGSGMMLGGSTGLLDFLTTPTLEDPFLTTAPTQRSPTLGGSSPGATSAGGALFDNPFCRPEDFTC